MRVSRKIPLLVFAILLILLIAPVCATGFAMTGGETCVPAGAKIDVNVNLSDAPQGLSGLNVSFNVDNPAVAEISGVTPPGWGLMPAISPLPSGQAWLKVIDLNKAVNSGAQNIPVGTLELHALKEGTTVLTITSTRVEDDSGGRYTISPATRTICVGTGTGPELTQTPADLTPAETSTAVQPLGTSASQQPTGRVTGSIPEKPASRETLLSGETPQPGMTYSPLTPELAFIAIMVASLAVFRRKRE